MIDFGDRPKKQIHNQKDRREVISHMRAQKMLVLGLVIVLIVSGFGVALGSSRGTKLAIEETENLNDLFAGGSGTESDPYQISNVTQLQKMNEDLDSHYELVNDIDASVTKDWNDGKGFKPIGNGNHTFTGTLDGQGYSVIGLYIHRPESDDIGPFGIGLFGYLGGSGSLDNIAIIDANVSGSNQVGGLVGNNDGAINNSYAIADVSGVIRVGGLVGYNSGTVNNSYASGNVSGDWHIGGLVGNNAHGTVKNSYATGDVSGDKVNIKQNVGGLVGTNQYSIVNNSYATGNVSGVDEVGGLVGENGGTVTNSYATGDVNGNENVGGLVGINHGEFSVISYDYGIVSNSYATGTVSGAQMIGGLVGYNFGTTRNSYFVGTVNGNNSIGGLVGYNKGPVYNSHYNIDEVSINGEHRITIGALFDAQYQDWISSNKTLDIEDYSDTLVPAGDHYEISGVEGIKDLLGFADDEEYNFSLAEDIDLSGESGLYIPYLTADFDGDGHTIKNLQLDWSSRSQSGLIGHLDEKGKVTDVALMAAHVRGNMYVGPLVGYNEGTVKSSYTMGNVSGIYYVGGLVGWNDEGMINCSYATRNVSGNISVGGLVGMNYGIVKNSYAKGKVNGNSIVGGLVGKNFGVCLVKNSYARGDVSGNEYVGGLIGLNDMGNVSNSYATGKVSGNDSVGGLVGKIEMMLDYGTITDSFWDVTTTGQPSSAGGTGKTTAEMKDIDTFTDTSTEGLEQAWDFVGKPNDDSGYYDIWKIDENGTINNGYPYLTTFPPTAVAKADETTVEMGETVRFDASNSTDNMGIKSYSWELSNGTTVSGETITHSYDSPGEYTVTLTVTDYAGNTATDTIEITVEESGDNGGIPGFTTIALLVGISFVVLYRYRKKNSL